MSYSWIIFGIMTIGAIAGYSVILVLWVIKDKSKFYRGWIIGSGVRNFVSALLVAGGISGIVGYYSHHPQVGWTRYIDLTPLFQSFVIAALIFIGITAGLYFIKSRLMKNC